MSHEIQSNDSTLFIGQPAWHGLGTVLPKTISIDEALQRCLPWEPQAIPIVRQDTFDVLDHRAIIRSDDKSLLSVVSGGYNLILNSTVAKAVSIAFPEGQIESAGSLRGGKQVWFLVRLPKNDFAVGGGDEVQGYGLITSSHDGTIALVGLPTGVRVVCANTMAMALAGSKKPISVRHKGVDLATEAQVLAMVYRQADLIANGMAAMKEGSEALASKPISAQWMSEYISEIVAWHFGKSDVDTRDRSWSETERLDAEALSRTIAGNLDNPRVRLGGQSTSAWTAFNAVTEWSTHDRRIRGDRGTSNFLGSGAAISKKAFDLALSF